MGVAVADRNSAGEIEPAVLGKAPAWASDEELAEAALRDYHYFDQLYLRYADRVYRYALGRVRSPAVADDVVGDTMVAALERLDRFDPEKGTFASWLFTIAGRRIADQGRASRRFWRLVTRQPPSQTIAADDAFETVARDEENARVRRAVEQLSGNHREVVLLRYVADLPIRDIADVLDTTESAAKMRLNRALKRLADELGDHDERR